MNKCPLCGALPEYADEGCIHYHHICTIDEAVCVDCFWDHLEECTGCRRWYEEDQALLAAWQLSKDHIDHDARQPDGRMPALVWGREDVEVEL